MTASGEDYAEFSFFIDGILKGTKRSGPSRNVEWNYSFPLALENTKVLLIKVIHENTAETLDFEAALYAFTSA